MTRLTAFLALAAVLATSPIWAPAWLIYLFIGVCREPNDAGTPGCCGPDAGTCRF